MPWQPEGPQEFKNLCFIFNSLSLCCQKPFLSVKGSVDVSSGEGVPAVGVNVDSFTFSHGQRLGQCGQFCPLSRCSGCQWLCPDGLCFRGYGCPHVSDSFSAKLLPSVYQVASAFGSGWSWRSALIPCTCAKISSQSCRGGGPSLG